MNKIMNLVNKCSKINNQVIISSFFIIILLAGLYLSDDYGISIDEPFHRTLGYFWFIQIFEYFSTNTLEIEILKEKYNSMFWSREITGGQYRQYGVIFDLICVFLEESFKITDNKSAFQLKHKFNFLIFFLSSIFFFKIIYFRFQKKIFSLIVTFFYLSTPIIFDESFYNPKEIIFFFFSFSNFYEGFRSFIFFSFFNIYHFYVFRKKNNFKIWFKNDFYLYNFLFSLLIYILAIFMGEPYWEHFLRF